MPTDPEVRQYVYRSTVEVGRPPTSEQVASALGLTAADVLEAFRRLNRERLLALAPETGEIVMAPPFSASPTPFLVTVGERSYFANCAWDSFGVAATIGKDATVEASCACCSEPITLEIRSGEPVPEPAVAHFAVPAANWWDDLTFT